VISWFPKIAFTFNLYRYSEEEDYGEQFENMVGGCASAESSADPFLTVVQSFELELLFCALHFTF
jgi:hypothetical protein